MQAAKTWKKTSLHRLQNQEENQKYTGSQDKAENKRTLEVLEYRKELR